MAVFATVFGGDHVGHLDNSAMDRQEEEPQDVFLGTKIKSHKRFFTITERILARCSANFYCQ